MTGERRDLSIIALTWPIFIELFLRLLMGNVNVLMLSNYSDRAVAAVGVSSQILGTLTMLFSVVGAGTAIVISQYLGAGMRDAASKAAGVAVAVNVIVGSTVGILTFFFSRYLLVAMRLEKDLLDYADQYLMILGSASVAQSLSCALSAIARSYGHTNYSMYVAFGMNLVNLAGNYAVIFRPFGLPEFGVRGIAGTAVLAQILGAVAMWTIARKKIGVSVSPKIFRPFPGDILAKILRIGLPAAGDNASYNMSQLVITAIVATLGARSIAAKIYVQNVVFFVYAFGLSLGQGSQILIGYMVGAGKMDEAYRNCLRYLKIAIVSNSILSLVCVFLSRRLIGFFTHDAEILKLACLILAADFFVEIGRAFNNILGNTLRGAGDVRFPVIISVLSSWTVCVGLCYLVGIVIHFGLVGVWIAFAVDEWFRGLILLHHWKSRAWQRLTAKPSTERHADQT